MFSEIVNEIIGKKTSNKFLIFKNVKSCLIRGKFKSCIFHTKVLNSL